MCIPKEDYVFVEVLVPTQILYEKSTHAILKGLQRRNGLYYAENSRWDSILTLGPASKSIINIVPNIYWCIVTIKSPTAAEYEGWRGTRHPSSDVIVLI